MKIKSTLMVAAVAAATLASGGAQAALTAFQTFVGNVGVSTDGWGSTTQAGVISASVPVGATVRAAYLYTATSRNGSLAGVGGTLAGNALSYGSIGTIPSPACCSLTAARMDVTSIIKPRIDGGVGGIYNFNITETSRSQEGSALVVVYDLASLATSTVGILDGFAVVTGDTTSINFTDPLNTTAAGFFAEMRLGIGFSFNGTGCTGSGQTSTINVNGTRITNNAGCNDDNADASAGNGNLITVGGFDDPFSPFLPSVAADKERYNLVPQIANGSTSITVVTSNASLNDNIFLAVFHVSGIAGVNAPPPTPVPPTGVPEPMSLSLVALALLGLAAQRRAAKRKG